MSVAILKKTGFTSEEARLALFTGIVEFTQIVRGLLDDPKLIENFGKEAAKSNALNVAEIATRDAAIAVVDLAEQVRAEHADREEDLNAREKIIASHHEAILVHIEEQKKAAHAELAEHHKKLDGDKSTLEATREELRKKAEELAAVDAGLIDRETSLTAREEALRQRQAEIDRIKNLIAG